MKKVAVLVLIGFGVAFAIVIGQRMSSEAVAVVVGVIIGVLVSVPISLVYIAMTRRAVLRELPPPIMPPAPAQPSFPPLVSLDLSWFNRQGPPPPAMVVGENFQLMPGPKQDSRYGFQAAGQDSSE